MELNDRIMYVLYEIVCIQAEKGRFVEAKRS